MITPFSESDFTGFSLLFLPFCFLAWGKAALHIFLLTCKEHCDTYVTATRRARQRCWLLASY